MSKIYRIRVYIPTEEVGMLMGEAVSAKAFEVANEYQGMNGIISIMDGICSGDVLKVIISCGVKYFPNLFDKGTFSQHIYLHFQEWCAREHPFSNCRLIKEQDLFICFLQDYLPTFLLNS